MIKRAVQYLYDGAQEGINQVNETIDDTLFIDPEEAVELEAQVNAEAELQEENDRIDKINAEIDNKVEAMQDKIDHINQSFDKGVEKSKKTLKEISQSDIATAYRCTRLAQWGNMARKYIMDHPDWAQNLREKFSSFGTNVASKVEAWGLSDEDDATKELCAKRDDMFGRATDAPIPENMDADIYQAADEKTADICLRRNLMFGSPTEGILPEYGGFSTELALEGVATPMIEAGLEASLG
jgi:hypothetical protein